MPKQFRITLPEPPSVNRIYKVGRGRMYKTQEAKDYTEIVQSLCLVNGINDPITGKDNVDVSMWWYRKRKNGDVDNRSKLIFDALQGFAYVDDKQIRNSHRYRRYDKNNPRIELVITEIIDTDM